MFNIHEKMGGPNCINIAKKRTNTLIRYVNISMLFVFLTVAFYVCLTSLPQIIQRFIQVFHKIVVQFNTGLVLSTVRILLTFTPLYFPSLIIRKDFSDEYPETVRHLLKRLFEFL